MFTVSNRKPVLDLGGSVLWDAVTGEHDLDAAQLAQLTEACRAKDRLDRLDAILRTGDADFATIEHYRDRPAVLVVNSALREANTTAQSLKQLLAALRLPDEVSGKRPQYRGPRTQRPSGAKVSSLERARAAKTS